MDLHTFTKSLLWLNLASKRHLENMRLLRLWGHFGMLFFIFFIKSCFFCLFVCFFSQIALSAPGPDELETASLLLGSVCRWPEVPPPQKATKCLDGGSLGQGEQTQEFWLPHTELWSSGSAAGGLDHGGHGQCDRPPSPFSACGVRGSSVCPPFPSLLSTRSLSFNLHALPAHYKAPSGLQNPSTPELVSMSFLFLSFPNVLLFLCATS